MSESLIEATEQTEAVQSTLAVETSDRPEWLPEKFSDPAELGKAYKELSSKLGEKEETIKKQLTEEFESAKYANRPTTKGDYTLPDTIDESSAVDSELLSWWAEHSFDNGYGQEAFEAGIQKFMESTGMEEQDLDAERVKLGDNSSARTEAASLFANKFFPPEVLPAIERMCETSDGIIALEFMMESQKDPSVNIDTGVSSRVTEDSLRSMMMDERYHNPNKRDANYVKEIEAGFKKIYG